MVEAISSSDWLSIAGFASRDSGLLGANRGQSSDVDRKNEQTDETIDRKSEKSVARRLQQLMVSAARNSIYVSIPAQFWVDADTAPANFHHSREFISVGFNMASPKIIILSDGTGNA